MASNSLFDPANVQFWCSIEIITVFGCILAPILICNLSKFARNRYNVIYQRRFAKITIFGEGTILCIKLFLLITMFLILSFLSLESNKNKRLMTILLIFTTSNNIAAFSLYLLQFWRFYLLHYEIKWSVAMKSKAWQSLINPKFKNESLNFYISTDHKKTYGSSKWVFWRFIFPLIFILSILFNIHLYINQYYSDIDTVDLNKWYEFGSIIFDSFIYGLPFIFLYILYRYKLPSIKFEDVFFVRHELKRILKYHIFNWIFYILYRFIVIILSFEGIHNIYDDDIFVLIICININLIFLMEFCSVYTSINWVRKRIEPLANAHKSGYYNRYNNGRHEHMPLMSMTSSSFPSYIDNNTSATSILRKGKDKKPIKLRGKKGAFNAIKSLRSVISYDESARNLSMNSNDSNYSLGESIEMELKVNININIKLGDVLSHKKGFESFIQHLSSEFSIENLLCLVELSQFQMFIYQYLLNKGIINEYNNNDDDDIFATQIIWPENVPRSLIVYGENDKDDKLDYDNDMQFYYVCKKKAKLLFEKYINTSSEYEVNLSYTVRNKLISLMRNESLWMLNNNKYQRNKQNKNVEKMSLTDLLHIFDTVIGEVFSLMQDAFNRFKNTNDFGKVKKLIIKNK